MSSASARPSTRPTRALAVAGAVALAGAALAGPLASEAQAEEVVVQAVRIVPAASDVATGFVTLRAELDLVSDTPLPTTLGSTFGDDVTVWAEDTDGRNPLVGSEYVPVGIAWGELTLVSGTTTDGTWAASTEVTRYWNGTWTATEVDFWGSEEQTFDVTAMDASVTLGSVDLPSWKLADATPAPLKVVTGQEQWAPRIRLTERASGAPVAGFFQHTYVGDRGPIVRLPASTRLQRADAAGYGTAVRAMPVSSYTGDGSVVTAYAGRGSRGYSLEAVLCVGPHVKWQANERVATGGRTVTLTGNAWPAPSIYPAVNSSVNFQVWTGSRWSTVSTSRVRDNGRYTLQWTAPAAGTYQVRAYKPGGVLPCTSSVGTVLPSVTVSLP